MDNYDDDEYEGDVGDGKVMVGGKVIPYEDHLIPVESCGEWTVEDPHGGVWLPNDICMERILAADDPPAEAVRICVSDPYQGRWSS